MSKNKRWNRGFGFCLLVLSVLFTAFPVRGVAASWTKLTNLSPDFPGTMLLLSDGSVMVQNNNSNFAGWMRLRPAANGSYISGTWATDINPMSLARLYFASNILSSGKVWVLGGEYSGPSLSQNITPKGEIWDPVANTWSPIPDYPTGTFGDDPSMVLPGGKIIAGDIFTNTPRIYDIASNTWSGISTKFYGDRSDEESWAKIGNGNVLTYDLFQAIGTGNPSWAETYDPATNVWSSISPADGHAAGAIPVLSTSGLGFELGPILRLQDGRVFAIGATNHTALYNPATNTWAAGPDTPGVFGADDAPAAEMPNGHVVYAADGGAKINMPFQPPTNVFEFDPVAGTTALITPPDPNLATMASFPTRMALLPTGQVLFSDSSRQMWVYTGDGGPNPALRPVVNNTTYNGGGVFTLTGKQLNGQSAGAGYGDDAESDENFPIVRLQSAAGVFYCRTFNWSTVGVDGSNSTVQTVSFTLNKAVTAGNYSMTVIGAGIPSFPIFVNITQNEVNGL